VQVIIGGVVLILGTIFGFVYELLDRCMRTRQKSGKPLILMESVQSMLSCDDVVLESVHCPCVLDSTSSLLRSGFLESFPKSLPKKARLNSSVVSNDTAQEPLCLDKSSFGDSECVFVESRLADAFHFLLIFSLNQDVKPTLDVLDALLGVYPTMLNSINAVDVVQNTVSSLDLIVTLLVSFDTTVQNTVNVQRDYTYVPDDIAELTIFFADPESLDKGNALINERLSSLPESFLAVYFDDEFIPYVEDADESLFVPVSIVVPGESNDTNPACGDVRFDIATVAELENVRRGGVRRSESNGKWASRSFDDWRKIVAYLSRRV
jgi:hypothetical protein